MFKTKPSPTSSTQSTHPPRLELFLDFDPVQFDAPENPVASPLPFLFVAPTVNPSPRPLGEDQRRTVFDLQ